jgi:CubicO group peptidase (beta-lactamase class C family)
MKMRYSYLLIITIFFSSIAYLSRAQAPRTFEEAIHASKKITEKTAEKGNFPGIAIAVAVGGNLVWADGIGYADWARNIPIDPFKSKFRIGSISKSLTAIALAQLYEKGLLDLNAEIQQYVPQFPKKKYPVTVRQVAQHIGGIRHYRGFENLSAKKYETVNDGLDIFIQDTLIFEPGTKYSYSSYGWNLLSAVVEGASKQSFLEYMQAHVFDPAGLEETEPDHADTEIEGRVSFYISEDNALKEAPYVDNSYKWAGGGFLSTATDLTIFGQAVFENKLMGETVKQVSWTSGQLDDGKKTNYGLGWRVNEDKKGRQWRGHSGGSVGGSSMLLMYPEHELIVVTLVNLSGAKTNNLPFKIAEQFLAVLEK